MSDKTPEFRSDESVVEDVEARDRREFLVSLGKWSKAVIGGVLLGGVLVPDRESEAQGWGSQGGSGGIWYNSGGGWGGWINAPWGWYDRPRWYNGPHWRDWPGWYNRPHWRGGPGWYDGPHWRGRPGWYNGPHWRGRPWYNNPRRDGWHNRPRRDDWYNRRRFDD